MNWVSSLSLVMPTKIGYTTHSSKHTGYISTKHHSTKRSKGSFEKPKWSVISTFSFKSHSLPLPHVLSYLFFLQDKKRKASEAHKTQETNHLRVPPLNTSLVF